MSGPTNGEMGLTPKDIGMTPPAKEGLTKFGGSVSLNAFSMAVDNGGIKPKDENFELDYKKILEVARSFPPENFQMPDPFSKSDYPVEVGVPVIPDGYNIEERTRRSVRDVIKLYQDSGIVDHETLVQAGKFAGPGNIDFDGHQGSFDMTKYFQSIPEGTEYIDGWIPPVPATKKERDENIKLAMNRDFIPIYSLAVMNVANKNGFDLTPEQVFDIGIQRFAIHEMGHAYDTAIGSLGSSTFYKASHIPDESLEDVLRKWSVEVHREHLARGIESILLPSAIEKVTSMGNKDAKRFAQQITRHGDSQLIGKDKRKVLSDFLRAVQDKSINPKMVFDIERKIEGDVLDMDTHGEQEMSEKVSRIVPVTFAYSAYNLKPYTLNEVRYIMDRSKPAG